MGTAIIRSNRVIYVKSSDLSNGALVGSNKDAIDVLGYRAMRLSLRVLVLEGTAPLQLGVGMETGMDLNDPDGFVSLGIFDLVGEKGPSVVQRVFTDLQRYIRWRVFVLQDDAFAHFTIEGVVYD